MAHGASTPRRTVDLDGKPAPATAQRGHTRARRRLLRAADATAVVAVAASAVVILRRIGGDSTSTWVDDLGELAAAWLAAGTCAVAAARHRGRGRLAWSALAASAFSWGSGEALWSWFELIQGRQLPFPSPADAGFMTAVPFALLAILCLPAAPLRRGVRARTLLDGLIITIALAAVSWTTVLGAVYSAGSDGRLAMVLSLAYPASDVAVCAMVLTFLPGIPREGRRPLILLSAGLAANAMADSSFAYLTAAGSYGIGNAVDVGWIAGYLLIALGALRASMRPAQERSPEPLPSRWGTVLPYLPVLAAGALTVYQKTTGHIEPVLFAGFMAAAVLVILRQALALSQNVTLVDSLGHDPLTRLPNADMFRRRAGRALANCPIEPSLCAALYLDLDDFKEINDRFGPAFGDLVMQAVAGRVRRCLRRDDIPARIRGDEFAVLLVDVAGREQVLQVAERMLLVFEEAVTWEGQSVAVRGTIGIAIRESAGDGIGLLLDRAAVAMTTAKRSGKGRCLVYSDGLEAELEAQIALRTELVNALSLDEFFLEYQPIVELTSGRTAGFEALLRWRHPRLGILFPNAFVAELETGDLIVRVGSWILEEAARQVMAWRQEFGEDLFVSVNVSSRQILDPGFTGIVESVIKANSVSPGALVLEITESGMVDHPDAFRRLDAVRRVGALVALDDFGTGYSSLAYLQRFPVDVLKIDKSFIEELPSTDERPRVAQALIQLGEALHLTTIAEGVEREAQQAAVLRSGCSLGQGFLYARPLSAEGAADLVRREAGDRSAAA